MIGYNGHHVKKYESFVDSTKVIDFFIILTELKRFLLSFVLWSFQVLGKVLMDYGIKSGKSLSLGMPKAPHGKSMDTKNPKLGDAPEGIPSFVLIPR